MNTRERFIKTLNFEKTDRRPIIEWAPWWKETLERFEAEGAPKGLGENLKNHYGLDRFSNLWMSPKTPTFRKMKREDRLVTDDASYERIKPFLYWKEAVSAREKKLLEIKEKQEKGECIVWMTLEGFFWFPRTLFGIEEHLYAFYDEPELYHKICQDIVEYDLRIIEEITQYIDIDIMTFAEDMSYNLGPMISEDMFEEFMAPYYRQVIPALVAKNIIPFMDTDGLLEDMIPWMERVGIKGALPLERQAGVDVNRIRKNHPNFMLLGAYDKMVMSKGEKEMRKEFERLLPLMRGGGYVQGVDHQTPPGVSLENYKIYLKLQKEYAIKAIKDY